MSFVCKLGLQLALFYVLASFFVGEGEAPEYMVSKAT